MNEDVFESRLTDGRPVVVSPLGPEDRDAVAEGYRRLSPDSRYQRFWVRTGEVIGDAMLNRLLARDPGNHEVWAVLDPALEFPGLGAASYWRTADAPGVAEFSCTVLDREQRAGIGTLLLAVLWLAARRGGIRRFVAYTMPENRSAVHWMRDAGATATWDGFKVVFELDLESLDQLPPTRVGIALAERLGEFADRIL